MEDALSADEKITLITQNLQEVLKSEIIENVIKKEKRSLIIYWGTATTGRPHCAYFVPMVKIAHFLLAGCTVKILLADIHACLDHLKTPEELVNFRAEYYKFAITALLRSINVPIGRLEFVVGSSYQFKREYIMDLFRLSCVVTDHDAKKAGAGVVKQAENPTLNGLIYPLMQALDEQYLGVDAQFGGVDQRKIFTLATEKLQKLNYKTRAHLMNPMVPGLSGGKMSASDPDSKIDVLDTTEAVKRKLKRAHAVPKEVEGNGIISFVEFVLLPVDSLKNGGQGKFVVEQKEGAPVEYTDISKLKEDYIADILTPQMLKLAATNALNELLRPIQEEYSQSIEWQEIAAKAYPPPEDKKKVKRPKDRGSRFPGASGNAEAKADGHVDSTAKGQENSKKSQPDLGSEAAEAVQSLDIKANGTTSSIE